MILDSGTLKICTLNNVQSNGLMPVERLVPVARHWFQERAIGMHRQYLAKGVNERVDLYVYIHYEPKARAGRYVITGDGEQFRINSTSSVIEENTNLRYTTMELQRLDTNYELAESE